MLFPRAFGGLNRPWVQRLVVNCCTILPCLGVALGVPGESGTVLSFTGATGGWAGRHRCQERSCWETGGGVESGVTPGRAGSK
jgi:hypothetical protein